MELNIVGAKNNVCGECRRGLSVASSSETRAYVTDVTDVTDRVSFPATSSKIDSIHPFESDNFSVSVTIKGNSYVHSLTQEQLRYLLLVTFYSVSRFQTGFHGGYHSPFHFHSVCRFELFHSVRRFQLLWHVSPSRWFFSACVAFQLAISGVSRFH